MTKIAQLLPNRINATDLIVEWRTISYCATIIGVSFRCACRNIFKKKIIDSGIEKAHRLVKATENRAQFQLQCEQDITCSR